jgi:hypothetical protein
VWDITVPSLKPCLDNYRPGERTVVSHISRKTSEIWGTRRVVRGTEHGPRSVVETETDVQISVVATETKVLMAPAQLEF